MKASVIENMINKYRGIFVREITIKNNFYNICFTSECNKLPLILLIASEIELPVEINVKCYEKNYGLIYIIKFNKEIINKFFTCIKKTIYNSNINEKFYEINNFKSLNKNSKIKIINYIKFLRTKFPDGAAGYTALNILNIFRFCRECGEELYSQEEEMRTILEFDTPEKVFETLEKINCEKENDNED